MRAGALALALFLAACSSPPTVVEPTPQPSRDPGTLAVIVLLDLSGPRSSIGTAQRNAMQLWLDQQPASARIKPLVKFVDLASGDARLLIELRRAAVDDRADAVVVGMPFAYDETFARALDVAGLPVVLTLPAPEPAGASGRWAFALAPTYADLARVTVDDASLRNVLVPTLLVSDESPEAIAERVALSRELERRGFVRPTVVTVSAQDAAQRIRAGASVTRSILFAGPASTYLDATRSLASAGITPRTYLSYLTESADMSSLGDAVPMVTWPGSRNIVTFSVPPASRAFLQAYMDRHGAPSTVAATAYDALTLLDSAAEAAGGAPDREQLRDRIEAATFAGIATRYRFSPSRHSGFDADDIAYLRWITVGRPGIALAPEPQPKEER